CEVSSAVFMSRLTCCSRSATRVLSSPSPSVSLRMLSRRTVKLATSVESSSILSVLVLATSLLWAGACLQQLIEQLVGARFQQVAPKPIQAPTQMGGFLHFGGSEGGGSRPGPVGEPEN